MQIDIYTKSVLTVIAISLAAMAWQGIGPRPAVAMGDGCGGYSNPCYVEATIGGLNVNINR